MLRRRTSKGWRGAQQNGNDAGLWCGRCVHRIRSRNSAARSHDTGREQAGSRGLADTKRNSPVARRRTAAARCAATVRPHATEQGRRRASVPSCVGSRARSATCAISTCTARTSRPMWETLPPEQRGGLSAYQLYLRRERAEARQRAAAACASSARRVAVHRPRAVRRRRAEPRRTAPMGLSLRCEMPCAKASAAEPCRVRRARQPALGARAACGSCTSCASKRSACATSSSSSQRRIPRSSRRPRNAKRCKTCSACTKTFTRPPLACAATLPCSVSKVLQRFAARARGNCGAVSSRSRARCAALSGQKWPTFVAMIGAARQLVA